MNPKYSSYCKVDKSFLVQAIFTEQPGVDMISDFQGVLSHQQCIINTNGDGLHHDTMEITVGSNTERNRLIRISLFGKAVHRYDTTMFSKMCELIQDYIVFVKNQPPETRKSLTIGINVNEAFNTNDDFDITLEIYWNIENICMWPKCIRSDGICYIISQKTLGLEDIESQ
ncbi:32564_t:CDS:2, partial [Racocetra persica]